MTDLLTRDITSERNYFIIQKFNKIIPSHKRETSVGRKKIKIIENNDLFKIGNTKIYNIENNNNNIKNKSIINNFKKINNHNNNTIKSNNENSNYGETNSKNEKINDIINNYKGNNITDINMILKTNDKSKTFNRFLSTKNIKNRTNIYKNKSNQIINNSKIKIERNKGEIFIKKLNNDNNNKTADINKEDIIKKNSKQIFESKLNKNNIKRNTDGIIHIGNQKIIFNENLKKIKDKDKSNKVKTKLNNKIDKININNYFNHTVNPKSNILYNINDSNIIISSNSLKNNSNYNNKINNLEGNLKKRKNIDINTEYQTNPDNNIFSPRKNILINNLNNTTNKVKLKTNNVITNIEMDKDKEFFHLTENSTILKTKSNAKKKLENKKDEPDIEIRIINTKKNEKIIFNNKRLPINNIINKNNGIYNNNILTEENTKINNNEKYKIKNNNIKSKCVKVKKNQNDSINRNNTYNNNETSFLTINNNNSILDEINNDPKHNVGNYNFANNAHNNINSFNINNLVNASNQNSLDNNINNKINTIKVFKSNSNTNKNIIFQNFHIFSENKNYNYNLTINNYSNCNTGNTTNNILNQNNSNINNNNFINNKIKTERENIEIINKKIESKNSKELENKEELILIELDDEKDPKDTDEINNIENKKEIIKSESLKRKLIEESKEKDISLDKSTSLRVYPVIPEDFIEKDDEVIKLFNSQTSKDNNGKKFNNNIISQNNEEDESEIIIQNSEFSIMNDFSKFNYNINNKTIYQNQNIYMNYNNANSHITNNNNSNINLENITMKDTSIISNFGIKGCKSITQAGKERTGHRKKNQDNYIIEKNINNLLGFNLFAILDGHGENGHLVSQLTSKYLIKKFTNISKDFNDIEKLYDFLKKSDFLKIINIFLETDKEIINQKNFDISLSGTTCVLIIQLGEHLICSNIGDSRAILIYEENNINKIFELSHDSKPDIPEEKKRITLMGGRVDKVTDENGEKTGPYRVYIKDKDQPGLAMSRSFGDKKAKSCGVIPYPDIIEYNLNNNDCKYMVLCSDGVWEFLSNEEVMEIGNKYYSKNNMTEFCNELLKKSTEMWKYEENYMDDITIVTVFF